LTTLPADLKKVKGDLNLSDCSSLTTLPADLKVEGDLGLWCCSNLTTLSAGLKVKGNLGLWDCSNLTTLSAGLKVKGELNLSDCSSLTTLPADLKVNGTIDLRGCTSLIPTRGLLEQLEAHERNYSGVDTAVFWPEHFQREEVIKKVNSRLDTAVERYKEASPAGAPNTQTLFHRFSSEGLAQRSGASEVVTSLDPLVTLVEKEPKNLEWIELIASRFLDGCVNQPVAGISELNAWAHIEAQPTPLKKLESANYLRALEAIRLFISERPKGKKPGSKVEVEAGNLLLREIHEKLVSEGMAPWPGVPKKIAYDGCVEKWCKENIQEATKCIQKVIADPLSEVCDYLLIHPHTWGAVAFPEELEKVKAQKALQKEALSEMSSSIHTAYKVDPEDPPSSEVLEKIKEYEDKIKQNPTKNRLVQIGDFNTSLKAELEKQLIDKLSDLTRSALTEKLTENTIKQATDKKHEEIKSGLSTVLSEAEVSQRGSDRQASVARS
jgi:hypothetical protein